MCAYITKKAHILLCALSFVWHRLDLNQWHKDFQSSALPTELRRHCCFASAKVRLFCEPTKFFFIFYWNKNITQCISGIKKCSFFYLIRQKWLQNGSFERYFRQFLHLFVAKNNFFHLVICISCIFAFLNYMAIFRHI